MITVSVHDLQPFLKDKKALKDKKVKLSAKDIASILGIKQSSVYIYLRRKGLNFHDRNSKAIVKILQQRMN